jgi:hypothetical protein
MYQINTELEVVVNQVAVLQNRTWRTRGCSKSSSSFAEPDLKNESSRWFPLAGGGRVLICASGFLSWAGGGKKIVLDVTFIVLSVWFYCVLDRDIACSLFVSTEKKRACIKWDQCFEQVEKGRLGPGHPVLFSVQVRHHGPTCIYLWKVLDPTCV